MTDLFKCTICSQDLYSKPYTNTPCQHYFHWDCFVTHTAIYGLKKGCPSCQADIIQSLLEKEKQKSERFNSVKDVIRRMDEVHATQDDVCEQ